MKTVNLDTRYGSPPLEWPRIESRLESGIPQAPETGGPDRHTCWLTTINPDGSPHVTGIGGLWLHGAFLFKTGDATRKAKNLARDARCAMSVATREFDLVVDGEAREVTDSPVVAELASRLAADGWPARVDESGQALTADYSALRRDPRHGSSTVSRPAPRQRSGQWNGAAPPSGASRKDPSGRHNRVAGPSHRWP